VPAGFWTIQMFFYFPLTAGFGLIAVGYGQACYATLADAQAAQNATTEIDPTVSQGTFRAWLFVKQGCTDLSDAGKAVFQAAGKFGMTSAVGTGGGGEANVATDAGLTGVGLVLNKAGVSLPFKSVTGVSPITTTNDVGNSSVNIGLTQSAIVIAESQVTNLTTDLSGKVGTGDARLTDKRTPTDASVAEAKAFAVAMAVAFGG
jgi:hypothetical protein